MQGYPMRPHPKQKKIQTTTSTKLLSDVGTNSTESPTYVIIHEEAENRK